MHNKALICNSFSPSIVYFIRVYNCMNIRYKQLTLSEETRQLGGWKNLALTKQADSFCKEPACCIQKYLFVGYYLLLPNKRRIIRKRLMKSRYKVKPPINAIFEADASPYSKPAPIRFSF